MRIAWLTILMLIFSTTSNATDDLFCSGKEFSVYMSVGSDHVVDSASITNEKTKESIGFRLSEITNNKLVWLNSTKFDGYELDILLKDKEGHTHELTAKGKKRMIHYAAI